MSITTNRIAARAAATLLAAASVAGLTCTGVHAAPAAPASISSPAPAPAFPTPIAPVPADVAGAVPAAAASESDNSFTKGTSVWFRNATDSTMWVREHHIFTDWYVADELQPGEAKSYSGNYGGVDDVQLRIFRSAEDARENSMFKAIEVDAENPAWTSPWLSVSYHSKSYDSVGTVHHYESALAGAHFTGKRNSDSNNYKQFELHMTKGWN